MQGKRRDEAMSRTEYELVHACISRALAPELSPAEVAEAAEEDWCEDAGPDAITISFEQYADGLYALADMWRKAVDELEYVVFLNKLFRRITKRRPLDPARFQRGVGSATQTNPLYAQLARSNGGGGGGGGGGGCSCDAVLDTGRDFRPLHEIVALSPLDDPVAPHGGRTTNHVVMTLKRAANTTMAARSIAGGSLKPAGGGGSSAAAAATAAGRRR